MKLAAQLDFDGLVRANYRLLFNYAYRLTHNRDDAEDLMQETLVRAYQHFDHYTPSRPFTNWLFRILHNQWDNRVGNGFRVGTMQVGFRLGIGIGTKAFGSRRLHDLALTSGYFGRVFSPVVGKGQWYRGNWEWLCELWGGGQLRPDKRALFGITPMIRYNFATGSRWVPFVNLGAGFSYTDIRGRDLSTEYNFNIQVGAGAHYFLRENTALTVQYRWFHLSNAGIKLPNNGTNTQMFFAGLSWFF